MKILVFSDSHGKRHRMEEPLREHLRIGDVERVFFLGDGLAECMELARAYPQIPFDYVRGNCDGITSSAAPAEKIVEVGSFRFLLMHGHPYDVKYTYQKAADRGIEQRADVVLFGHTHHAEDLTIDGSDGGHVRMINPGSAGEWFHGSYAVLDLVGKDIVCGFGRYDH